MSVSSVLIPPAAFLRRAGRWLGCSLAAVAACVSMPLTAQDDGSREVVQPLPPPEAGQLAEALRVLARSPDDLDALIAAGKASVVLDDMDAAESFFARAQDVSFSDPRIRAGIASMLLRQENPFDALRLFEEAEAGGVDPASMAADRGLAFDLVGNNAAAQEEYRRILSAGEDDQVRMRYALSLAIAGDQYGSEAVLLPLLQRRDLAAYRARAFALAALGKTDEAVAIAEAVLPPRIATRMVPYLRFMPRLTRAQQAAAATLGNFPKAQDIGRDDPRIALYAAEAPPQLAAAPRAEDRLSPGGAPLGRSPVVRQTEAERRTAQRHRRDQEREVRAARQQVARTGEPAPSIEQERAAPDQAEPAVAVADVREAAAAPPAAAEGSGPAVAGELPPLVQGPVQDRQAAALPQAPAPRAPEPAAPADRPALEAAPPASAEVAVAAQPPADPASAAPGAAAPPAPEPEGLAQAFADFVLPAGSARPAANAVDITRIEPPRERPASPPPAEPEPPAHPSRFWVQVATGRDVAALGFDWRRLTRNHGELLRGRQPFTFAWGQTNRLVTGPFDNRRAALDAVEQFKQAGLDSFMFTSREGEEARPLPTR